MSFTPATQQWHSPLAIGPSTTPPTISPISAPQPSKAVPERKPKLRASCDSCAASKVKCSKEHPICSRCASNGSQCVYGVSRKHGKPGRTRKRNPDGTPFVKRSKRGRALDGSEFGKFRVRAEPLLPDLPSLQTSSGWSTPEWTPTPEFEYERFNYEMTPDTTFGDASFSFMEDLIMTNARYTEENIQTMDGELTFRDPFAKKEPMQLDLSLPGNFQSLEDFMGGDSINLMDYGLSDTSVSVDSYLPSSTSITPPESPKGSISYLSPLQTNIAMPTSHCCYSLAYSTLESLQLRDQDQDIEVKSLDSVLSVTRTAVQNVMQLLNCRCAADAHLAMLYSSIASKIIYWYQIAAGLKPASSASNATTPTLSTASSPCHSRASSSSTFSSPLSTPTSAASASSYITFQPLKIGAFSFDDADQEALRKQVVLRELEKCGALVEALADWQSEADAEQAEFLYGVLGTWLKSELEATMSEMDGGR